MFINTLLKGHVIGTQPRDSNLYKWEDNIKTDSRQSVVAKVKLETETCIAANLRCLDYT